MKKRLVAALLTGCIMLGMTSSVAYAAGETPNVWNGDKVSIDVVAGENGYTFLSAYPGYAYEMSNHMVSANGGANNDIPQTLMIIDASKDYTWTPDGVYSFGTNNYEVMYCCDVETPYENEIYYKRMNLEDSAYYNEEAAAHIRAIISNSYPYVSLDQMKANLAAEGFADADKLTRAEVISAVQTAVWGYANGATGYRYSQTFDVPTNTQWGKVVHDYTNEMEVWWQTGYRKISKDTTVEARINALADHLMAQEKVYAEKNQIIISDLEIVDFVPIMEKDGVYKIAVRVVLNNSGSSELDNIHLTAAVDGNVVVSEKVELGTEVYTLMLEAEAGQKIEAVVSGEQILPAGVYFYEPKGGREVSQSLVGVAQGRNDVYAAEEVVLEVDGEPALCNLVLQKQNDQGNALAGAEFALYAVSENGNLYIDSFEVDENGRLIVENLLPGTYELVETVAPEGYALPIQNIRFTVTKNGETAVIEVEEIPGLVEYEDMVMEVINYEDEVLGDIESPDTGSGAGLWVVLGSLAVMVILVGKKRVKDII